MPGRPRRRPLFIGRGRPRLSGRQSALLAALVLAGALTAFLIPALRYFRVLTGAMAVSNATDLITKTVSDIVEDRMRDPDLDYGYFVSFERDNDGGIVALVTDMARVNVLSADLLNAVVEASDSGNLDLEIPLGNLLGSGLLLGRGPDVPVKITMLTSSRVDFRNELVSAGINQTKHQLLLELTVDVDVLLPWEISSTQVKTEVLVAETIIVGSVPQTYVSYGE